MENKLKKLFDYQRFEKNANLERFISETECRYAKRLSDDDLSKVNAAREIEIGNTIDLLSFAEMSAAKSSTQWGYNTTVSD